MLALVLSFLALFATAQADCCGPLEMEFDWLQHFADHVEGDIPKTYSVHADVAYDEVNSVYGILFKTPLPTLPVDRIIVDFSSDPATAYSVTGGVCLYESVDSGFDRCIEQNGGSTWNYNTAGISAHMDQVIPPGTGNLQSRFIASTEDNTDGDGSCWPINESLISAEFDEDEGRFVRIVANYYLDLESTITNYDDILGIPGDCNPAPSPIYEKVIKAMGTSFVHKQ